MTNDFQYDSCISKGICSINPRTYALQAVLVLYLRFITKYALNLYQKEIIDKNVESLILNTITIAISNPEFTENSFTAAVTRFKEELPAIIEKYNDICGEEDFAKDKIGNLELFKETKDVISSIRYGESEIKKNVETMNPEIRDLQKIMLIIAKSISINLMDLESFDKNYDKGYLTILKLLNKIGEDTDIESLKTEIKSSAVVNNEIMHLVRLAQEERYGKMQEAEVSFSTVPSKAVLVVGSNIRELETILEALKETDIDVYTHDDMMIAHNFPVFNEYKNLKGQYGQGVENCLLDFATFPGAIILTKHSLHNIENLYRGLLFTTDYTCPKGVIQIENDDFSKVIEASENAKGFKTGKQCESVKIGCDYEKIHNKIKEQIESKNYKRIILIGLERYSLEQKTYFEKLIKLAPNDTLIISFSYNIEKENVITINACFDSYCMVKFYDDIKNYDLPISAFFPKCDRNSISQMIYFAQQEKTHVFVGKCTPILLNPSLMTVLQEKFSIDGITNARKDLEKI